MGVVIYRGTALVSDISAYAFKLNCISPLMRRNWKNDSGTFYLCVQTIGIVESASKNKLVTKYLILVEKSIFKVTFV